MSLGALLFAGCFVGDAADGLPCEQDGDCGIGVACQEDPATSTRCCGGACLMGAPDSTTSGSTTAPATTSTDVTGEPTSGTTMAESSTTSAPPMCGNGVVDPDEECDPAVGPCTDDCLLCGNGVRDEGEFCDPEDEMLPEGSSCETCQELVLLSWEGQVAQVDADFDFPSFGPEGQTLAWQPPIGNGGPLRSGPYFGDDVAVGNLTRGWPQSWLLSRPLRFPELAPSDQVEVTIEHAYAFDYDDVDGRYFDHGRVDLIRGPGPIDPATEPWDPPLTDWISLLPAAGEGQTVECVAGPGPASSCFGGASEPPAEAFCDGDVSTEGLAGEGGSMGEQRLTVDPEDVSGETLRLSFRLRYDCANFADGGLADAWTVSVVRVTARP